MNLINGNARSLKNITCEQITVILTPVNLYRILHKLTALAAKFILFEWYKAADIEVQTVDVRFGDI